MYKNIIVFSKALNKFIFSYKFSYERGVHQTNYSNQLYNKCARMQIASGSPPKKNKYLISAFTDSISPINAGPYACIYHFT